MNIFICNSLSSVIDMLPRTISSFAVFGKDSMVFIALWKKNTLYFELVQNISGIPSFFSKKSEKCRLFLKFCYFVHYSYKSVLTSYFLSLQNVWSMWFVCPSLVERTVKCNVFETRVKQTITIYLQNKIFTDLEFNILGFFLDTKALSLELIY